MRNNWIDILDTREGYFLLAVQLYHQLSKPNASCREIFSSGLSHCSLWFKDASLTQAAKLFRLSSQQWSRISEVFISLDESALQEAFLLIRLDKWSHEHCMRLLSQFVLSNTPIDISFRKEVFEHTLLKIIELETKGMEKISHCINRVSMASS